MVVSYTTKKVTCMTSASYVDCQDMKMSVTKYQWRLFVIFLWHRGCSVCTCQNILQIICDGMVKGKRPRTMMYWGTQRMVKHGKILIDRYASKKKSSIQFSKGVGLGEDYHTFRGWFGGCLIRGDTFRFHPTPIVPSDFGVTNYTGVTNYGCDTSQLHRL